MDDVDGVHAQIARNMLESGDWVTARLNGIAYLEKSPLVYWTMATSYRIFGVHDWAARLPIALGVVALCLITSRFGAWAFGKEAGQYAGVILATAAGLFLFTRILIPDAMLTLTFTLAFWAFLRALESGEQRPRMWAAVLAVCIGLGMLLKGLIAVVFPIGAMGIYMLLTGQVFSRETWKKLHVPSGLLLIAAVAAPWHVIATLRNPPFFDLTMHSGPGQYRGFFWFYFINEHVLRFLNLRYPRDYNTVPRLWFWLLHIVWLFPWSVYFPALAQLSYRPRDRAGRARLLALCWIGVVMVFFSFSTTQEYYSVPIYPALALLLGSAMSEESSWFRWGNVVLAAVCALASIVIMVVLWNVWTLPTPGDISVALTEHPELYTLSMGHMADLTLRAFAYLKLPLVLAGIAALIGVIGTTCYRKYPPAASAAIAVMMVIFLHAARLAMITFNPYLGSKPLADALISAPPGKLIEADEYYAFSSVFFYTNRRALLWNGRKENLEYGSYAPGAPAVFIGDDEFQKLWRGGDRYYLLAHDLTRARELAGSSPVHVVYESGGKVLASNQ
jgi:4-amino-4-deoxy-L-arabinose transferase-like glycosyltransferase